MKNDLTTSLTSRRVAPGRSMLLALVAAFLVFPSGGQAAVKKSRDTYVAQRMIQSDSRLVMAPGATATFTIGFKNTGTATWKGSGPAFVGVYTTDPKYRRSVFEDPSWRNFRQPSVLRTPIVKPGEIGFVDIKLRAPKTPGNYTESFALTAEDVAWVAGGAFSISIAVTEPVVTAEPPANAVDFQALRISPGSLGLTLRPHETQSVTVLFKNVGRRPWIDEAVRTREAGAVSVSAQGAALAFRDASWPSDIMPQFTKNDVAPGEVHTARFVVRAPNASGNYLAQFALVTNGVAPLGGEFDIPITVTDEAGNTPVGGIPILVTIPEPVVRVGLYTTTDPLIVTAPVPLEIRTAENGYLGVVSPGTAVAASFAPGGGYRAAFGGNTVVVSSPIRLVPTSPAVLTITNYINHPRWSKKINDNAFRGILELRTNEKGKLWVINELPLEDYLRGLAETTDGSPSEYHKAIIVAARTYAFFHTVNPNKHSAFTIDAYWDQVYRGYNSEQRMPNFAASVEETRGAVVTYGNEVVVTPYFARSNGRTKTWRAVWGGADRPWIASVAVPWDKGYRQLGHGVGMSATAAAAMAKEGQTHPEILKYFYVGTGLQKVW